MRRFKVTVEIEGRESVEVEVEGEASVRDIEERVGLNPVEYVAIRDGKVIPEDEAIRGEARIRLVPVVSGG